MFKETFPNVPRFLFLVLSLIHTQMHSGTSHCEERETMPMTLPLIPLRVFTGSGVHSSPDENVQEGLWKAVQTKEDCVQLMLASEHKPSPIQSD